MTFISIVHIILAVVVVILVLIQDSKGGGLGAFSGGGSSSNSLLGPTGATSFLAKVTRWVVIGFAITSVILTNLTSNKGGSALDTLPVAAPQGTAPTNPAAQPPADAPAQTPTESK